MKSLILIAAMLALSSPAQRPSGYPAAPAGAPSNACSMEGVDASAPVRILLGSDPIPYAFACAQNPGKPCIGGHLDPGLVVSVAATSGEWSCVSGGDSTSGWVPTSRLGQLPAAPAVSLKDWIGWWRSGGASTRFTQSDRLLITPGATSGSLRISGRAYWYGANDNVHYGQINADAKPIGAYLHIVEGDTLSACILDLHYHLATHTFTAYDNAGCGGMNVRFSGEWSRFTPSIPRSK